MSDHYVSNIRVKNPHASSDLMLDIKIFNNTPKEDINAHVRENSKLPHFWVTQQEPQERAVVIVGGGPSAKEHVEDIRALRDCGAFVMALNGASGWLSENGLFADTQFIMDAKQETSQLVDFKAKSHLFASQVHPDTMRSVNDVIVFHLMTAGVEDCFPPERRKRGNYALIGGGVAAGNSALCVAYCLGYRDMHLFGLDSCHSSDGQSHAYAQPINEGMPLVEVEACGKTYLASVAMKAQADIFIPLSRDLESMGCMLCVYGGGLLQDRYRMSRRTDLTEKQKYELMWSSTEYRRMSPAEEVLDLIVDFIPPGPVLDLGCGTARAAVALDKLGYDVTLVDIANNCRDADALSLRFVAHDLSKPLPKDVEAPYGYCCDVMEHVPPGQVDDVLRTIRLACSEGVFFRIEHGLDGHGPAMLGRPLHLSVHDEAWWTAKLKERWSHVESRGDGVFLARA